MLDAYLKELAKVRQAGNPAPGVVPQAAAVAAPVAPATTAVAPGTALASPGPVASAGGPARQALTPPEAKQRGRWLLHEGREHLLRGNYDLAQAKVNEARSLEIQWGLFDDTPDKLQEDISKVRPAPVAAAPGSDAGLTHDRRMAKAKLQQARAMLNDRQFEQAEALALEVKRWGLSYGLFDDTPDKVAAAARALRRRDKIRNTPLRERSSQGVYDELVHESRQYMKAGRLDDAETKAKMAQRMGVVPGLEADRAESVLHDIAMLRAKGQPSAEPSSPRLAIGNATAPAMANVDTAPMAAAQVAASRATQSPTSDPAVQRIAATETVGGPELTPPTDKTAVQPAASSSAPAQAAAPIDLTAAPATPAVESTNDQATAVAAPANRGEQLLAEAKSLFTNTNYAAALQLAKEAKAGKFGVDAQADEMIAQIGMAAQARAISLYEEAMASLRKGDNQRARALLTEVAADETFEDETLKAKVEGLLQKLAGGAQGGPGSASPTDAAQDAETLGAQKLNAEVGTKIAEARRLSGDRSRQGHRHLREDHAGRPGLRPPARADASHGHVGSRSPSSWPRRTRSPST